MFQVEKLSAGHLRGDHCFWVKLAISYSNKHWVTTGGGEVSGRKSSTTWHQRNVSVGNTPSSVHPCDEQALTHPEVARWTPVQRRLFCIGFGFENVRKRLLVCRPPELVAELARVSRSYEIASLNQRQSRESMSHWWTARERPVLIERKCYFKGSMSPVQHIRNILEPVPWWFFDIILLLLLN